MKKLTIFAFSALLLLTVQACEKAESAEPSYCNETVYFVGKHVCFGYMLKRPDGSLLRAVQFGNDNRFLDNFFRKNRVGDKLVIGTTSPDEPFDCTIEDTLKYTKVKLTCAKQVFTGNEIAPAKKRRAE